MHEQLSNGTKKGILTEVLKSFCHEYMKQGNATQAYENAYYINKGKKTGIKRTTMNRKAVEVMKLSQVIEYIAELRKGAKEKCIDTVESIAEELRQLTADAYKANNLAIVEKSIMSRAKILGIDIERKSVEVTDKTDRPQINLTIKAKKE